VSRVCQFALRVTARPGACRPLTSAAPPPPSLLASPSRPINAEHPACGVIAGSWGCGSLRGLSQRLS